MILRVIAFLYILMMAVLPVQGQQPFKIMTYNIKYDDKNDVSNNWEVRRPWVTGLLNYHAPEIFGIQEALHHQVEDIKSAMAGYTYVGVGRDDGKQAGEYSPLFYDSTRFGLVSSGTFWLSETPGVVSKGWDAALPRICTYAELRDSDGKIFVVYNAHFDHIGVLARRKSIEVIGEHMDKYFPEYVTVFMGDLNFTDSDPAYETAISLNFRDSRDLVIPYGPNATFNGFQWDVVPENRIDYVFLRGNIQVKSFAVITDSRYNRYPSDHFPVLVECIIEE